MQYVWNGPVITDAHLRQVDWAAKSLYSRYVPCRNQSESDEKFTCLLL